MWTRPPLQTPNAVYTEPHANCETVKTNFYHNNDCLREKNLHNVSKATVSFFEKAKMLL